MYVFLRTHSFELVPLTLCLFLCSLRSRVVSVKQRARRGSVRMPGPLHELERDAATPSLAATLADQSPELLDGDAIRV